MPKLTSRPSVREPLETTFQVIVADIDGDGDFDLVAASRDEGRVVWYENLSITTTNTTSDADDPAQTPAPAGVGELPSLWFLWCFGIRKCFRRSR